MSILNFGKTISLQEFAHAVAECGHLVTLVGEGEMGIGKSAMLKEVAKRLPTHLPAYIDCTLLDLGDFALPYTVEENGMRVTRFAPNARFRFHEGQPVIIMLDEFTKGADPVKNMLHPMLEKANPRLGDIPLSDNTIVFLTGNLTTDGVGDSLKAHSRNRLVPVTICKPDAEQWIEWAIGKGIEPEVIAWVNRFPHVLASYTDAAQGDNPYIYNPRKSQHAFVSPRSLETASNIVRTRKQNDPDSVIAALTGAIGESGARDMQAYIEFSDQLPTWEATIKEPKTTVVPTSPGACAIVVFGAIARITKETIAPFMEYLSRFDAEWQAVFAINIAKNPAKQSIAFSSSAFKDWVVKNQDLL